MGMHKLFQKVASGDRETILQKGSVCLSGAFRGIYDDSSSISC